MAPKKGTVPKNFIDRTGTKFRKLTFKKLLPDKRWLCVCDCGNETIVSTSNILKTNGCRYCANRKDITNERVGNLVAIYKLKEIIVGSSIWVFKCDCGGTIQGTVREFHAQWLRSCGCMDNAYTSWTAMMSRCYKKKDPRYKSYGGRGIKVEDSWHSFSNFIKDMGERPKRHNLGRIDAEKSYSFSNCKWEHVSLNCRDTKNDGTPTKQGLLKNAKPRKRF